MVKLADAQGNVLPIIAQPMGEAQFSDRDFLAKNPESGEVGVPFGIVPASEVILKVINLFGQEVDHLFEQGPNPYLIRAIKQQDTGGIAIYYYI